MVLFDGIDLVLGGVGGIDVIFVWLVSVLLMYFGVGCNKLFICGIVDFSFIGLM